ncbi:MAG: hypothetical protein WA974_18440 [Thermodesulfobacteriota bacterium]
MKIRPLDLESQQPLNRIICKPQVVTDVLKRIRDCTAGSSSQPDPSLIGTHYYEDELRERYRV